MGKRAPPKTAPKHPIAKPLTTGSPVIGVPALGQVHELGPPSRVHDLDANGIVTERPDIAPEFGKHVDAPQVKNKPMKPRDVTLYKILDVLPWDSMSTAKILEVVKQRWPVGSKPVSRDTLARRLNRRPK
jgi:hypothetical protein